MDKPDEALMTAFCEGDNSAFAALVARHGPGLFSFIGRMASDRGEAEDLFQETFKRVVANADKFDARQSFKTWLYAIASRITIDAWRRRRRRPQLARLDARGEDEAPRDQRDAGPADTAPDPSAETAARERQRLVRGLIDELPTRQRLTLCLVYFRGLSHREAAEAMACSVGTVKKQMSRALHSLARRLPDPGEYL